MSDSFSTEKLSFAEKERRQDIRDLFILLLLLFVLWLMFLTYFGGGGGGGDIIIVQPPVFPDFYYKHFFRHLGPSDTFDNINANNNLNNVL